MQAQSVFILDLSDACHASQPPPAPGPVTATALHEPDHASALHAAARLGLQLQPEVAAPAEGRAGLVLAGVEGARAAAASWRRALHDRELEGLRLQVSLHFELPYTLGLRCS